MDEPLSQLDARLRVETRGALRHLQKELGITTVYVTHDQLEAQGVADKIVVMDRGRILQVGSPREIYEDPSTLFVAGFIGTPSMNFARGTLEKAERGWHFQHPEFQLGLKPAVLDRFERIPESGAEIVIGIRPEHIETTLQESNYSVPAKIDLVEPQSNELILDISLGGTPFKTRQDKRELGFRPELEQEVYIIPNQNKLLIFDEQTEARLV
jgi:multiple sugar transport system ATP-binding protein